MTKKQLADLFQAMAENKLAIAEDVARNGLPGMSAKYVAAARAFSEAAEMLRSPSYAKEIAEIYQ